MQFWQFQFNKFPHPNNLQNRTKNLWKIHNTGRNSWHTGISFLTKLKWPKKLYMQVIKEYSAPSILNPFLRTFLIFFLLTLIFAEYRQVNLRRLFERVLKKLPALKDQGLSTNKPILSLNDLFQIFSKWKHILEMLWFVKL